MVAEKSEWKLSAESGVRCIHCLHSHYTTNGCRFTCKRANHIAIKPKAEASKKSGQYTHSSKNEVMVSRKMHKVNTQIRRRRFEQNLENGFFAEWTFYICAFVYLCVRQHPSNLFIIKSSKNYHFCYFCHWISFPFHTFHFISTNRIFFSNFTGYAHTHSQQKCTGFSLAFIC